MIEYKTRTFTAIVEMLRWFAGHQTRNVGVCIVLHFMLHILDLRE